MDDTRIISHAEARRVLRRAGVPKDVIEELDATLPDPIDLVRDEQTLVSRGVTREHLIEDLGGSP